MPIYSELKESDAYRVLTPTERLVLLDMLRLYNKASAGDKEYPDGGFNYVWQVCLENVSENYFYSARTRLCDLGFFDHPPEIQEMRPAAPTRFLPSREWSKYEATASEAKTLAKRNSEKKDRIRKKKRRRTDFRSSMGDNENRSSPKKVGRHDPTKVGRHNLRDEVSTPGNLADTTPDSGNSHPLKVGRYTITSMGRVEECSDSLTESTEVAPESERGSLIAEIEAENRRAQKWVPKRGEMHRMEALAVIAGGEQ